MRFIELGVVGIHLRRILVIRIEFLVLCLGMRSTGSEEGLLGCGKEIPKNTGNLADA